MIECLNCPPITLQERSCYTHKLEDAELRADSAPATLPAALPLDVLLLVVSSVRAIAKCCVCGVLLLLPYLGPARWGQYLSRLYLLLSVTTAK